MGRRLSSDRRGLLDRREFVHSSGLAICVRRAQLYRAEDCTITAALCGRLCAIVAGDIGSHDFYMRSSPTVWRALKYGVITETVLCGISVASVLAGGFGPCGPTGNAPGFVRVIHQPAFWASGFVVEDSSPIYLILSIVLTTVMLSALAYVVLKILRERHKKPI